MNLLFLLFDYMVNNSIVKILLYLYFINTHLCCISSHVDVTFALYIEKIFFHFFFNCQIYNKYFFNVNLAIVLSD